MTEVWILISSYGLLKVFSSKEDGLKFIKEETNKNNFKKLFIDDSRVNNVYVSFMYKNPFSEGDSFGTFTLKRYTVDEN